MRCGYKSFKSFCKLIGYRIDSMRLHQQYISVIKQSFEDLFQSGEVYLW